MNWTQIGDSGFVGDQPVCLSHDGNRVAIGSFHGNEGNATVKVLDFDGAKWNEVGRFSGLKRDYFGYEAAVALSGDGKRLAIGAFCAWESANRTRGHVLVYEHKEGTVWEPLGPKLTGKPNDTFGRYISMSKDGNRIAVSSDQELRVFEADRDLNRRIVQAIVKEADWGTLILEFLGENWNQVGRSLVGGYVDFSADGKVVAVGFQDGRNCSVRVFKYSSNQGNRDWVQVGERLDTKNIVICHKCLSINAKGNLLAVCNAKVELFCLNVNNWKSMGEIFPCYSVCLAPDANKIAVSFEDKNEIISVKVLNHDGNEWILEANVMPPSGEMVHPFSVSLSSSGDRLAIGFKDYEAHRGRVRNYKLG